MHIPQWEGFALGVAVNGGEEELVIAGAGVCRIGDKLRRDGTDELAVRVYGHRRNQFGPFYVSGKPPWIGPRQFRAHECREKQPVPFGLSGDVEVFW